MSHLVGVASQTTSYDGIHIESLDLGWVLADHVAQLIPHLMVGLATLGNKVGVVDTLRQNLTREIN